MRTIAAISSVECGKQTMSGGAGTWYDSPRLWCSRTAAESFARSPSSALRSSQADSIAVALFKVLVVITQCAFLPNVVVVVDRLEDVTLRHFAAVDVQRDRRLVDGV